MNATKLSSFDIMILSNLLSAFDIVIYCLIILFLPSPSSLQSPGAVWATGQTNIQPFSGQTRLFIWALHCHESKHGTHVSGGPGGTAVY